MKHELPDIQSFFQRKSFFFKEIQYFQFLEDFLSVSKCISHFNIKKKSLIIIEDQDPYRFLCTVFGCMNAGLTPCLWNWYFSSEQEKQILNENIYSGKIKDGYLQVDQNKKTVNPKNIFSYEKKTDDFNLSYTNELVFYSSGTVHVKACLLSLENLFQNAKGSSLHIPFYETNTWGLCLPHFHVGGFSIFIRALLSSGTVQATDLHTPSDDITHLSVVPTQLYRFKHNPYKNLQYCLVGGSKTDLQLLENFYLKFPLYISYGMTEMASQIATSDLVTTPNLPELKILSHSDVSIYENKICVRGPSLFKGYLNNNIPTMDLKNGYFVTSDLGKLSPHLVINGRSDHIFQTGGENISCQWIESQIRDILLDYNIRNIRVTSEAEPEYGEVPVCYLDCDRFNENLIFKINSHLKGFNKIKKLYFYQTKTWKQEK